MNHSNYPDDIREYDDDPRSPFYNGDEAEDEPEESPSSDDQSRTTSKAQV